MFLSELAEVTVIRPGAHVPFDIEDRFACVENILRVLLGLVVVQEKEALSDEDFHAPGHDDGQHQIDTYPIVRLSHFSVREYLTSSALMSGHASPFSMDKPSSRHLILESCFCYIEYYSHTRAGVFEENDIDDFPLLSYSFQYWEDHADHVQDPLLLHRLTCFASA